MPDNQQNNDETLNIFGTISPVEVDKLYWKGLVTMLRIFSRLRGCDGTRKECRRDLSEAKKGSDEVLPIDKSKARKTSNCQAVRCVF